MELNEAELLQNDVKSHLMVTFENELFLRFVASFPLIVFECGRDFADFGEIIFAIIGEDTL